MLSKYIIFSPEWLNLISSFLFSIQGVIVFNDETIIEGEVKTIDNISVVITPHGLNFPEEILLQSIDSVAYVRFASVYKNFREAKDFEEFLGVISSTED